MSQAAASTLQILETSPAGEAFIAAHEGVVLKAYPDPGTGGAPWTIGIGHTSAAGGPKVSKGMVITRDQAFAILKADLKAFEKAVLAVVKVALTQSEFDALVSLCFNIGPNNFATSTLVKRLNAGDRVGAAAAFLSWTKAAGRVLSGLVLRRQDERNLFLSRPTIAMVANDNGVTTGVLLQRGSPFPEAVRALQSDLVALGYELGPAGADGDFGKNTEAAVFGFQHEHGLTADGKAGPATRAAIAAALKAKGATTAIAMHPLPGDPITAVAA